MNTPKELLERMNKLSEETDELRHLGTVVAELKLLHEQQTQSLLTARIEAKLVADELEENDWGKCSYLTPLISRLRKIAEGK